MPVFEQPQKFRNLDEAWSYLYKLSEQLTLAFGDLPADQTETITKLREEVASAREVAEAALKSARA